LAVAEGNGLLDAEMHIAEIAKIFPLNIELYGFDTGTGLPPGEDYRDLLHYFRPDNSKCRRTIHRKDLR
jgi:hypothetical protein